MFDRFRRRRTSSLPLDGWPPGIPSEVDRLQEDDLAEINRLLPWQCFTVDGLGRRLGDRAHPQKRAHPQPIPDPRIELMDDRLGLRGTTVLEVGCFEGVHTIGLCASGSIVTAVDARPENVAKTLVRAGLYGYQPRVLVRDLEEESAFDGLQADLAHHVGVLYHLEDPVGHLLKLGACVRGMMLDTHVSAQADASYDVGGVAFEYSHYTEGGRADPFSGMRPTAKWLTIDSLREALRISGFANFELVEERDERNGPRILAFATR